MGPKDLVDSGTLSLTISQMAPQNEAQPSPCWSLPHLQIRPLVVIKDATPAAALVITASISSAIRPVGLRRSHVSVPGWHPVPVCVGRSAQAAAAATLLACFGHR